MEQAANRDVPSHPDSTAAHRAVAVVLTWNGRVGLFRRSQDVDHDRGKWHCVSGLIPPDRTPPEQACIELAEETGLSFEAIECLVGGPVLQLADEEDARSTWTVHTFVARVTQRRLELNWEHDGFRWVRPRDIARFDGQVSWLGDVLESVAHHLPGHE